MTVPTDAEDRSLVNDEEQGGASLMATTANYVNSIIGSGMIGIPFALKEAGFGLGLILLVLVAILTDYSLRLMVRAGTLSGTSSYQVNTPFPSPTAISRGTSAIENSVW